MEKIKSSLRTVWLLSFALFILCGTFWWTGCATSRGSGHRGQDEISSRWIQPRIEENKSSPLAPNEVAKTLNPTLIVFLVSGMSTSQLLRLEKDKKFEASHKFFELDKEENRFFSKTSFSSSLWTNISSLLTHQTVAEHGIIGEQFFYNGQYFDLKTKRGKALFKKWTYPRSVFHSLKAQGREFWCYSNFCGDMLSEIAPQSEMSWKEVDADRMRRVLSDLKSHPPAQWPRLIFVHLEGVEALSHRWGPHSKEALGYLAKLDEKLKPIYDQLNGESGDMPKVTAMLTSDHGNIQVKWVYNVSNDLKRFSRNMKVIKFPRRLQVYWKNDKARSTALVWSKRMAKHLRIENVAFFSRKDSKIHILSSGSHAVVEFQSGQCQSGNYRLKVTWKDFKGQKVKPSVSRGYRCPSYFNKLELVGLRGYIVPSLANYFLAANSPDAIVVPKDFVSFTYRDKAEHGGFSPEEMLVPLLVKRLDVASNKHLVPIHSLLKLVSESQEL